jgi:hypothetical protein
MSAVTAADVLAEARRRHGDQVGASELGTVYEALMAPADRRQRAAYYTPQSVAGFMSRFSVDVAMRSLGPEPWELLRILAIDPACGAGMFLESTAIQIADAYLSRAIGDPADQLTHLRPKVLPDVILSCIFGVDTDPIAVDLSRLALSLLTAGELSPSDLDRHVTVGNVLEGYLPPAYVEAGGGPVMPPEGDPCTTST